MIKWTGRIRAFAAGIFVLTALGVLLYLPADFFDYGESVCLSVVLFDQECYGCGMTRGVQHLLHLDLKEAWNYNKLAFIVLPLGIFMVGHQILQWYRS
jgi:hypothetical protein